MVVDFVAYAGDTLILAIQFFEGDLSKKVEVACHVVWGDVPWWDFKIFPTYQEKYKNISLIAIHHVIPSPPSFLSHDNCVVA